MKLVEITRREAEGKNPAKFIIEDFLESGMDYAEVTEWSEDFQSVSSASSAIRRASRLAEADVTVKVDGQRIFLKRG